MAVRKRKWTTRSGKMKEAWVVDYTDQAGTRRLKTFAKKKGADAFAAKAKVEVRAGTHVADSATVTVKEAGEQWIQSAKAAGLERSTVKQYREHLDLHIAPLIGATKLSQFTVAGVRSFQDQLREEGRSPAMVRRATSSLGSILADAMERGMVARNVVRETARPRRSRIRRERRRLEAGVDYPSRSEVKAIIDKAEGRWRPFIVTAVFSGLRASELRGLRWQDVDLDGKRLHVRQRADAFNEMGPPKSEHGSRTVPLPDIVVNALKEWRLQCPRRRKDDDDPGELHLVFPNGAGNVESLANIRTRGFVPAQIAAGAAVDTGKKDDKGNPIMKGKYGLHALRHFAASWFINRPDRGGLGLSLKEAQERLGHATLAMTADTYGHLFEGDDNRDALNSAAGALLA